MRYFQARISGCERCSHELADWIGAESPQRPRSALSNGSTTENDGSNHTEMTTRSGSSSAIHVMELVERLHQREEHIRLVGT